MKLKFSWNKRATEVDINGNKTSLPSDPIVARMQILTAVEKAVGRRLRYDEWIYVANTPVVENNESGEIEL